MAGKHVDPKGTTDMSKRWGIFQSRALPRHRAGTPVGEHVGLDLPKLAPARPARPRYRRGGAR